MTNLRRSVRLTASRIGSQPATLQLRYLQTLTEIAVEKNSTIIFPLPMDLLAGLLHLPQSVNGHVKIEAPSPAPTPVAA